MLKRLLISCCLCVFIHACGAGSGDGLDANGQPLDRGDDIETPDNGSDGDATLATIQSDIFTPRCTACHSGAAAPRGLRLDSEDNSFNFLVNVNADEVPSVYRVEPGNPDASYLIRKLEGGPDIVGAQMPLGATPLSEQEIARIRAWISQGASASNQQLTTKIQGVLSDELALQRVLKIRFSRSLDTEALNYQQIQVYLNTQQDAMLLGENDYAIRADNNLLTITILADTQPWTGLSVVLNSSSSLPIYDSLGHIIDGDHNEQEGGEFYYEILL